MFADDMRRAIEAAPRMKLAELSAVLWKAYGGGAIGEAETQQLAELIEARKVVPVAQAMPAPRRAGSRPRTPESMERRRRWVASGWLPPRIAAHFTAGEVAALAVVVAEVAQHAQCTLAVEAIAGKAGVSRSTVKSALREAKATGLLVVITRPDRPFRHLTNVVRVISAELRSWIAMRRSSQGVRTSAPSKVHSYSGGMKRTGIKPPTAIGGREFAQKAPRHPLGRPHAAILRRSAKL